MSVRTIPPTNDELPGGVFDEEQPGEVEEGAGGEDEGAGTGGDNVSGDEAGGDTPDPAAEAKAKAEAEAAKLAADIETRRKELAELEAAKAARDKAEAEAARKARLDGGDILGVLGETQAERDAALTEVETLRAKVQQYEAAEQARKEALGKANNERLAKLPPEVQGLIPDGMDPEALAEKLPSLEAIAQKLTARPAGGRGGLGGGGGAGGEQIPPECIAEAERQGIDPKLYFQTGWRKRKPKLSVA